MGLGLEYLTSNGQLLNDKKTIVSRKRELVTKRDECLLSLRIVSYSDAKLMLKVL